jgi:plastocyanin
MRIKSASRQELLFKTLAVVIAAGAWILSVQAQTVTVTGTISVIRDNGGAGKVSNGNGVVWLKSTTAAIPPAGGRFKILQQHKKFEPHVLAVPVRSVVDFPNLDPFFHNVFSLFEGKRFDLGLYEAGSSHAVTFDAPGVCYIFCNIHPEMSAAVVVVDTPYYAVTNAAGQFSIPNVPPGSYRLNVWHERGKPERPDEFPREVTVTQNNPSIPAIRLRDAGDLLANHKNKYGRDYDHDKSPTPVYK